jgi:hypothetical protein
MDPREHQVFAAGAHGGSGQLGAALEKMLLVRAALPPFFWVMSFALGGLLDGVAGAVNPLLTLAIFVVLLVWLQQIFQARRGKTAYSPGMALGAWFIPVANIVLPALIVRDAWKAVRGPEGAGVVYLWWVLWIVELGLRMLYQLGFSIVTTGGSQGSMVYIVGATIPLPAGMASLLAVAMSLVSLVVAISAYGLLWHIVRSINEKA